VLLVVNKTIGRKCRTDILYQESIMQQDSMKIIVKFNVQDVMCLDMVNSIYSLKYLGADLSEELLMKSRKIQKFTDSELLDMIELYNEKVNNLLI
jgi:hypothetical protein